MLQQIVNSLSILLNTRQPLAVTANKILNPYAPKTRDINPGFNCNDHPLLHYLPAAGRDVRLFVNLQPDAMSEPMAEESRRNRNFQYAPGLLHRVAAVDSRPYSVTARS